MSCPEVNRKAPLSKSTFQLSMNALKLPPSVLHEHDIDDDKQRKDMVTKVIFYINKFTFSICD